MDNAAWEEIRETIVEKLAELKEVADAETRVILIQLSMELDRGNIEVCLDLLNETGLEDELVLEIQGLLAELF